MSSLSAAPANVGSGLGLPCRVYVHRDRIARGRVGVCEARGRCSWVGSGYRWRAVRGRSQDVGLSVRDMESLVCRTVLIHPDCETEPAFWMPFLRGPLRFDGQGLGGT